MPDPSLRRSASLKPQQWTFSPDAQWWKADVVNRKGADMDRKRLALMHSLHENCVSIRGFLETDGPPFAAILTDDKATRYLPFPHELRSVEGAKLLIRETMARYNTDDPLLAYAVGEHNGGHLIGFCGMNLLPDNEVEIMYAVVPARWGEGLGGTIAAALCAHVFAVDPHLRCVAFVHPANAPSILIAERLGFESLGLTSHSLFSQPVLKFVGRTDASRRH